MPEFVKNIAKTYNNHIKYLEYHRAWIPSKGKKGKTKMNITEERLKQLRSAIRAKTTIYDLAACNSFEFFATFTFSPDGRVDRYDYDSCVKYFSKWLNNYMTHYLVVPEKHKDGAYHFHALADFSKDKLKHLGGGIYKIPSYTLGRSNASRVKDPQKIAKYITKYITKDLMNTVGKGRKTYWSSRDLIRPQVEYNVQIPEDADHVFAADYLDIYETSIKNKQQTGLRVEPDETANN